MLSGARLKSRPERTGLLAAWAANTSPDAFARNAKGNTRAPVRIGTGVLNERARVRHTCGHDAAPGQRLKAFGKRVIAQGHLGLCGVNRDPRRREATTRGHGESRNAASEGECRQGESTSRLSNDRTDSIEADAAAGRFGCREDKQDVERRGHRHNVLGVFHRNAKGMPFGRIGK